MKHTYSKFNAHQSTTNIHNKICTSVFKSPSEMKMVEARIIFDVKFYKLESFSNVKLKTSHTIQWMSKIRKVPKSRLIVDRILDNFCCSKSGPTHLSKIWMHFYVIRPLKMNVRPNFKHCSKSGHSGIRATTSYPKSRQTLFYSLYVQPF